jgi:hypothetical protein
MRDYLLIPPAAHLKTLPLRHAGDCSLLGVSPDGAIYAEEVYGDEGWVAQHELRPDGTLARSVDEAGGSGGDLKPLDLPDNLFTSRTCWKTMPLNFAGPRHRGLREPERVGDLVRPLTIQEKMAAIDRLNLDILPPLLLGLAESYVLAESEIIRPNLYFVCRRIRLAYALPQPKIGADGQPYDYDTRVMYAAHFHDDREETPFTDLLIDLTGVPLHRPMDCVLAGNRLYIADGGEGERVSAIHVWGLELPETLTDEEKLLKKLYG